jgi:hypothetical protein
VELPANCDSACAECRSGLLSNIPSAELRGKLDAPSGKDARAAQRRQRCSRVKPKLAILQRGLATVGRHRLVVVSQGCCAYVFRISAGVNELVQLSGKFVSDVRAGRHAQEGWSNSMYGEHRAQTSCPPAPT